MTTPMSQSPTAGHPVPHPTRGREPQGRAKIQRRLVTETDTPGAASRSCASWYLEGRLAVVIADVLVGATEKQDASTALLLAAWE